MVLGLKRRPIFRTHADRAAMVRPLETVVDATGVRVLAWALLPNHFRLLLCTGSHLSYIA